MKAAILFVLLGSILGYVGNEEHNTELIQDMQTSCYESYITTQPGDCYKLIDQVQSRNYEVLSDGNGSFWAEKKESK